ncbi:hypothetical protein FQN50_000723 [Emmonsiellopsis sp. PD_5]|nr:hypothetical protein FQN50_000723 [Emmonsiellopsis sp. PD_5]
MALWNPKNPIAVEIIESSQLSPNDQCLLRRSVQCMLPGCSIPEYVLDRIPHGGDRRAGSLEEALLSIKNDLVELAQKINGVEAVSPALDAAVRKRENNRCRVTGDTRNPQATYIIAPSILEDKDLQPGGRLRALLEAYMSPKLLEQLLTFLISRKIEDELKNLWLLSPSLRHDFQHGSLCILRQPIYGPIDFSAEELKPHDQWKLDITTPEVTQLNNLAREGHGEIIFEPTTPDSVHLPLPKASLLRIHSAVSLPLHFLVIEDQIRQGWPPVKKDWGILGSLGLSLIRTFVHFIPTSLRIALYRYIIYGKFFYSRNRHLPFNLYVKSVRRPSLYNEANALRLVEKHTPTIPAPQLIDFVVAKDDGNRKYYGDGGYILMTRARGDRLDHAIYWMTREDRKQLGVDLGKCISQWRHIPNDNNSPSTLITSTLGGPAYDHQFEDKQCGPFSSTVEFADSLTQYLQDQRGKPPLAALYKPDYRVFFTHSDLHHTNIFVEAGRLSGVIDWEHAGFKPEYWEYTRSLLAYWGVGEHKFIMDQAFKEDYSEELEAQKYLWKVDPIF